MQVQAQDLSRVRELLSNHETRYRELAMRVARGDATMKQLIALQDQLRELQILAAAIQVKSSS